MKATHIQKDLPHQQSILSTSTAQGTLYKNRRNIVRARRGGKKSWKTVTFGHDKDSLLKNSWQLWLLAQDLCNISLVNHLQK